jgi:hypothetical protein
MPRIEQGVNPETNLGGAENLKARRDRQVNEETSQAILAGFDHEGLHYPYDSFEQQNFADTANLVLAGEPGPFTWRAFDASGEVALSLSPDEFMAIYKKALEHKAEKLAEGRGKKRN